MIIFQLNAVLLYNDIILQANYYVALYYPSVH